MKHRIFVLAALGLAATAAHATLTVSLDQAVQTIALPSTETMLDFTGTLTKDDFQDLSGAINCFEPGMPGDLDFLAVDLHAGEIFDWFRDPDSTTFTGVLFSAVIEPDSLVGLHDFANSPSGRPEVSYTFHGSRGGDNSAGPVAFTVDITPVPEPATLGVLGFGALVLRRRRR